MCQHSISHAILDVGLSMGKTFLLKKNTDSGKKNSQDDIVTKQTTV
jgi:hypothetical protein